MKIQCYLPAFWPASQTTQAPSLGVHFLQGSGPLEGLLPGLLPPKEPALHCQRPALVLSGSCLRASLGSYSSTAAKHPTPSLSTLHPNHHPTSILQALAVATEFLLVPKHAISSLASAQPGLFTGKGYLSFTWICGNPAGLSKAFLHVSASRKLP